jgi:hypothetical protein
MGSIELSESGELSLAQLYNAALAVCGAATDASDAMELLDCLGLLDQLTPSRIPA